MKKSIEKELGLSRQDILDLQTYAARYAHERRSVAPYAMNSITCKLIEAGIYPYADHVRADVDGPPTVWVKDGDFGWPLDLIEKHGWDGKKLFKEDK